MRATDMSDDPVRSAKNRSLVDVILFFGALSLAVSAQRFVSRDIESVAGTLCAGRCLPSGVPPDKARAAAARAVRVVALVPGFTNTCLTRALVASALLSDSRGVVLHVGFRSPGESGGEVVGHAWVTVDGCSIDPASQANGRAEGYSDVMTIPMDRRAGLT